MSDRPPPYSPETRAKGWRFELDYEKIEQSVTWDLAAELPMAQHALLMMWYVAWRQEPCGTFPNDLETIRAKCRIPRDRWDVLRPVLMRGWWLASDGLLYHDTVTKRVLEMVEYRRKEAARRAGNRGKQMDTDRGPAFVPRDTHGSTDGRQADDTRTTKGSPDTGTGTGTTPEADASGGASKSPRPVRKCPERFAVTAQMREWAAIEAPGVDVDAETAKFRDHTFRTAISDWGGTWRNWVRRAFENRPRGAVTPLNRQEAIEQRNREVGDRWLRNQEALDAQH